MLSCKASNLGKPVWFKAGAQIFSEGSKLQSVVGSELRVVVVVVVDCEQSTGIIPVLWLALLLSLAVFLAYHT